MPRLQLGVTATAAGARVRITAANRFHFPCYLPRKTTVAEAKKSTSEQHTQHTQRTHTQGSDTAENKSQPSHMSVFRTGVQNPSLRSFVKSMKTKCTVRKAPHVTGMMSRCAIRDGTKRVEVSTCDPPARGNQITGRSAHAG